MSFAVLQRAQLLISQDRHQEAISLLEDHLVRYPEDFMARCLYLTSLIDSGQKEKSRTVLNALLADEPDSPLVLSLASHVCLAEEKYADAEAYAHKVIDFAPNEPDSHIMLARVKLAQRNYDRAVESLDRALALDPESIEALNLKTFVAGIIGDASTRDALQEALQRAPENPFTIANQGYQMVRDGRTKEALERLKYALSLDPTNELARYAMLEAIKSKFFLYRLFFKYQEWAGRLTGTQSWIFLIGAYVFYRIINNVAQNNPELKPVLMPVVFVIAGLFLLTWIMTPLMNLFLLLIPYGRILLDDDDKYMARYTGIALFGAIACLTGYFVTGSDQFLLPALTCALFMIPLGTFLRINHPGNRKMIKALTYGILACGVLGALLDIGGLQILAFLGIFAYQWIFNGMMIKEGARTVD